MTRRATFTEAELRRAIKVADMMGKRVKLVQGEIVIVDESDPPGVPSALDDAEENGCDEVFGCAT